MTHVLVMAKSPVPGRVKTRLSPPCSPEQAAALAAAALADTLAAVVACGADRRVLALDGSPGDWIPPGFDIVAQRGGPFDERLANAWDDAGGPGLQIGMDTPQVGPDDLDDALGRLLAPGVDAVLGPALDGGWWAIGLHQSRPDVFLGVPMSSPDTGRAQRRRLVELGLRVVDLPAVVDVDTAEDALVVARGWPEGRFAAAFLAMGLPA